MGVGHFQLADTGGQEDFFYARLPYPPVQIVNHYRKVFGNWIECRPRSAWRSFHDRKEGHPTFVHQLEWHWIRADDAAVLTLTIRYHSAGDDVRDKPASDIQHVTPVEYPTAEARAVAESMGANCEPMAR